MGVWLQAVLEAKLERARTDLTKQEHHLAVLKVRAVITAVPADACGPCCVKNAWGRRLFGKEGSVCEDLANRGSVRSNHKSGQFYDGRGPCCHGRG